MIIKLANTKSELQQIIQLQKQNLSENISPETKKMEGFVTVKHDLDLLTKMNDMASHIIGVDNEDVVGYALVMLKEFRDMIPLLVPMFEMFDSLNYCGREISGINYYTMGQVCIKKSHRCTGLFQQLYAKHKACYSDRYELLLTEVSTSNARSMRAHEKVGFKTIHTFQDETDEWNILAWDWN